MHRFLRGAEQIRHFNEKGYIFPLDLFDEGEAQAEREYFEKLVALAEKSDGDSYSIIGWHRHCRGLYELVTNPRVLDICLLYTSDAADE